MLGELRKSESAKLKSPTDLPGDTMPTLNTAKYASVVVEYEYAPKVIDSELEYRQSRKALERLLVPERKLSVEEDALAKLLIHLIAVYEDRTVVPPRTTPRQVLQHLMEQRGLK